MSYKTVIDDIAAHVPSDRPMTARQIWERAGCWAPQSVRAALEEMARAGLVERTQEPIPSGVRYLYRKTA